MDKSLSLNLPTIDARFQKAPGGLQIYDSFRKKFVHLTPEEWVRQHFAHYLVDSLNVPASLLWVEHEIRYGKVVKRPDISVLETSLETWCVVECKAPHIEITEDVFYQAATYFSVIRPKFIALTNGMAHFYAQFEPEAGNFVYLKRLPTYS